jgi:hypothetical protein
MSAQGQNEMIRFFSDTRMQETNMTQMEESKGLGSKVKALNFFDTYYRNFLRPCLDGKFVFDKSQDADLLTKQAHESNIDSDYL